MAGRRFSKERIVEARGILLGAVRRAGLSVLSSQANFLFVKVPDADALRKAMAAREIMIRERTGNGATGRASRPAGSRT